jgi:hypothetical protein
MPPEAASRVRASRRRISASEGRISGGGLSGPPPPPGTGGVSQLGAGGGEEGLGQHAGAHVPVPGGPLADLVLVQAEQVLALAVVLLDLPAHPGDRDQLRDRSGRGGVGQEELELGGVGHRAADQQGVAVSLGGRLIFDGDRDRGLSTTAEN